METTIYYFTGTGNSLKIAKDLSENITNCRLVRICKRNMNTNEVTSKRVGFVFPVYYRGLPKIVAKFIKNLEVNSGKYFFAVANFGSYAALTFEQIDAILRRKGKSLSANFSVEMPGNMWFMYYPHPKEDFINRMNNQSKITIDIARMINNNYENNIPVIKNRDKEEKMYRDFNPNNIDENFWVSEKCIGCGICSKVCPAENIEIIETKPSWKHRCEQCLACIHLCPQTAIEFKKDSINKERYKNIFIEMKELF
ncbi:EFR1 family ferrodoxin [Clostridium beijerinckii]|uniref:Ferredoxin/flavodoxin n=1 Tax=Clostridium beijerinckii TaxID=1520 RepID=A0AAX0AYY2_CLOBE|nr:EFR1 family ferrodoxin [Clostridium beijerinckii]NRT34988.1 ferredoxin/flavodoxin [Clostridium beijerinckii]NRT45583.1 ferredoxin/flavodoxin [Clostridium beijerinckii]NRT87663.1 ferredoxin/flavodoxin [Clostridium beijerinckii]NRZ20420.1 ferredoxin/flavodoxin [Clostridium beijerinckii]NYC73093.1 ferredoxin/flavodoxin [Clostridium beijerinckii]